MERAARDVWFTASSENIATLREAAYSLALKRIVAATDARGTQAA
jgi:glutamate dehydrogenase/leucine dehydrogenase